MLACVLMPEGRGPELVRGLFAISPLVECAGDVAFLDVGGTSRLHGGTAGLFAALRRALHPHRPLGMGLAGNRFTAEVAARTGRGPVAVAPGEEAQFLAQLPLSLLPLPPALARRIGPLGLRTLGEFASLPAASVESRYGPEGVALHRLARGQDERGLLPERQGVPWQVHHECPGAVERLDQLQPALQASLPRLLAILREQDLGVTRLQLTVDLAHPPEGAGCTRWEVAPAAPETREALLVQLLLLSLEEQPPGAPVRALSLQATEAAPLAIHQGDLFGGVPRDPSRRAEALTRLACVLGEDAVRPVRPRADHRLEQRWEKDAGGRAGPPAPGGGAPRPSSRPVLRLLDPPEELRPILAGGRLLGFRRGRQQLDIARLSAPRRLEGGWWASPWARDEHDLLTRDGAWLRICRDLRTRCWLLLGEMD